MKPKLAISFFVIATTTFHLPNVFGGDSGIVYGRDGDNLPSPKQVIDFLANDMANKITLIRVYDANLEILEALRGKNVVVTIGVPDEAIPYVASSQDAANKWIQDLVITYVRQGVRFRYICVGNEAIPGIVQSQVQQAISNLHVSLRNCGIDYIFVTTAVGVKVLGTSYPPSMGQFAPGIDSIMNNLTSLLYSIGSPLLINIYPYYSMVWEPGNISLDYALFQSESPIFNDGDSEYYNLFDAMVDAFVAAMVRVVQKEDVKIVVAETGWPNAGPGPFANMINAETYLRNLRKHAVRGITPRRGDINLEVYVLEMFNENFRPQGVGRNFGVFYPNFTQVFPSLY